MRITDYNCCRRGDVLGFPVERICHFGACQIVAADTKKQQVAVALLDWAGEQMPAPGDLVDVPYLVKNFMFWRAREVVDNVPLLAPFRRPSRSCVKCAVAERLT